MRLIDADKLETHEQLEPFGNGNYEYVEVVFKDDIDDAPTIESERKKGKWNFIGDNMFECTHCRVVYTTQQLNGLRNYAEDPYAPRFCPNCGADMRGKND